MADTLTLNVSDNFDLNVMVSKLRDNLQVQGYAISITTMAPNTSRITLDKGCGGVNMLLGLGQGITVNISLNQNLLSVNYADGDWIGKIIGLAVGWILCFVPFITAVIGSYNQLNLPKKINNEISMILSGMQ